MLKTDSTRGGISAKAVEGRIDRIAIAGITLTDFLNTVIPYVETIDIEM